MSRIIKRIFPLLLTFLILFSIGWYLFEYDPAFTRDVLLHQARRLEDKGNHSAAVWLYNLAYDHTGGSDEVAIELAEKFKEIGNYSKAEYTLRKAISNNGSVELYIALSRTYVEQGKLRDAVLMVENASTQIQDQLNALRPKAPVASVLSGSYREYLTVTFQADDHKIYVASDLDYPSATSDAYTGPISILSGETTLFALSVSDNGLVSPLAVYNYIVYDVVEAVKFTDDAFDYAVRQALGYSANRVIYSDALWGITELTLGPAVKSCQDLKWLPNLQSLTIDGSAMEDTEAFAVCSKLEKLEIRRTTLSSDMVKIIGGMLNLRALTLTECSISSITSIQNLSKLEYLDLSGNAIRDISILGNLKNLTYLDLSHNALIDLDGLAELHQLSVLDISFNSIVSPDALEAIISLRELNLSSNALRNLDCVKNLIHLQKLEAAYNELLDIDALVSCQALTYLDVSHNTLLNVDSAASLPLLQVLDFSYNEVAQFPNFDKSHPLQILRAEYNQLHSLKKLAGMTNLTHLYLNYNQELSSISSLTSCTSLLEVYVYGTRVTKVSELTDKGVLVVYSPDP